MTTIAFCRAKKELATDSRISSGGAIYDDKARKIFRVNGSVIAYAGQIQCAEIFLGWFKNGCDTKNTPVLADFIALVFTPQKRVFIYEDKCVPSDITHMEYVAEGSGGNYAKAAMLSGASPKDAVRAAIKIDPLSGGRVQTVRVWK